MALPLILNLETASTVCSACIAEGDKIIASKEINNGFSHAENLHVFIDELLKQTNIKPSQLSAVAVSKGPGSYTGLRIGVSAAKGLCYSLHIPLIAVNTLQSMAYGVIEQQKDTNALYCAMLDARRMEVYCALYDATLNEIIPTTAKIIDEKSSLDFQKGKKIFFFGDGAEKCKGFLQQIPDAHVISEIVPSSKHMVSLSDRAFENKKFENVAYFEPYYLKEFFTNSLAVKQPQ